MNEEQRLNAGLVKPDFDKTGEKKRIIVNISKQSIHHLH